MLHRNPHRIPGGGTLISERKPLLVPCHPPKKLQRALAEDKRPADSQRLLRVPRYQTAIHTQIMIHWYNPLPSDEDVAAPQISPRCGSFRLPTLCFWSSILNVVLGLLHVLLPVSPQDGITFPQLLSSPARHVLRSNPVVFHSGFEGGLTIYDQTPSPEVDEAWDDLYRYALSKIPLEEAVLLPNTTYSAPGADGKYMVALDVFHQLHCLNQIRKVIHSGYYPETFNLKGSHHMRHCLSSLRQSLMCSSDVSVVVWEFQGSVISPHFDIVHMCRDFDAIKRWAQVQHYAEFKADLKVEQL